MADDEQEQGQSSYLNHLPAVFQQDDDEGKVPFIGRFLLAFERVLSGLGDPNQPGLEEIVDRIHTYFDPGPLGEGESPEQIERAPEEFLPWLAGWVALSLREDWDEQQKRRFIKQVVPLYRWRGTKRGLEQMLQIYTGKEVTIEIVEGEIEEGENRPHYFKVTLKKVKKGDYVYSEQIVKAIVDQEKPAHTYYHIVRVEG